jgi:hypothetical protein
MIDEEYESLYSGDDRQRALDPALSLRLAGY